MVRKTEQMPPKLNWKARLFAQSCVDLTSTRQNDGHIGSEVVVPVAFRESLDEEGVAEFRRCRRRSSRRSLPPDMRVLEEASPKPRCKPDVVHWKIKVG